MLFTDNMMMPKHLSHPYGAELLMNYYYEPEVAAKVADYVNYISPVEGAKEALLKFDPEVANNPLIFPPDDVRKRLYPLPEPVARRRARDAERHGDRDGGLIRCCD